MLMSSQNYGDFDSSDPFSWWYRMYGMRPNRNTYPNFSQFSQPFDINSWLPRFYKPPVAAQPTITTNRNTNQQQRQQNVTQQREQANQTRPLVSTTYVNTTTPSPTSNINTNSSNISNTGSYSYSGRFSPEVMKWAPMINQISYELGIPPEVAMALMQVESSGNAQAQSKMNVDKYGNPIGYARGLYQLMPSHFQESENPFDPELNARKGLGYYKGKYDQLGSWPNAYLGYFTGISDPNDISDALSRRDVNGTSGQDAINIFTRMLSSQPTYQENPFSNSIPITADSGGYNISSVPDSATINDWINANDALDYSGDSFVNPWAAPEGQLWVPDNEFIYSPEEYEY